MKWYIGVLLDVVFLFSVRFRQHPETLRFTISYVHLSCFLSTQMYKKSSEKVYLCWWFLIIIYSSMTFYHFTSCLEV
ncbi:hypothetical protein HanRHA438_Chr11g0516171 [Helianthus annuus]|nr:hypothetical protein HanRHA438_Chr11g0516171 [Helianthus annuus]